MLYHTNTTCNVICLQSTNVVLLLKKKSAHWAFQCPRPELQCQSTPAILITATVGSAVGLDADTMQSTLFGHGWSASLSLSPNAVHSFSNPLINTVSVFIISSFCHQNIHSSFSPPHLPGSKLSELNRHFQLDTQSYKQQHALPVFKERLTCIFSY